MSTVGVTVSEASLVSVPLQMRQQCLGSVDCTNIENAKVERLPTKTALHRMPPVVFSPLLVPLPYCAHLSFFTFSAAVRKSKLDLYTPSHSHRVYTLAAMPYNGPTAISITDSHRLLPAPRATDQCD